MRKSMIALSALTLPLAACASPYGAGYGSDPVLGALGALSGVLGSAGQSGYGGYNQGYGGNFQQAAVNACGRTASRYGQVGIRQVRQVSNSTLRVYGVVSNGYNNRNWDCDFRSDGRISDFDI